MLSRHTAVRGVARGASRFAPATSAMSTRELSVRIGGKKIKTKPLKVKVHGVNIIHDALCMILCAACTVLGPMYVLLHMQLHMYLVLVTLKF